MIDQKRANFEERIIRKVQENRYISTRDIALQTAASRSEIWNALLNEGLHPYHLFKIQHLLPKDYGHGEEFSQWTIEHRNLNRFIQYKDDC